MPAFVEGERQRARAREWRDGLLHVTRRNHVLENPIGRYDRVDSRVSILTTPHAFDIPSEAPGSRTPHHRGRIVIITLKSAIVSRARGKASRTFCRRVRTEACRNDGVRGRLVPGAHPGRGCLRRVRLPPSSFDRSGCEPRVSAFALGRCSVVYFEIHCSHCSGRTLQPHMIRFQYRILI